MMKRYELSDGKSHKFWAVLRQGSEVTTMWGRIGTDGQTKIKSFANDAAAQKEVDKVTLSKVKKGYALVSEEEAPATVKAQLQKETPAQQARVQEDAATQEAIPSQEETSSQEATSVQATTPVQSSRPSAEEGHPPLPDEGVAYLGALGSAPATAKPMTLKAAWKRLLGKNPQAFESVDSVDQAFFGTGSLVEAAMAGEVVALGDDPLEAGHRCAAICYQTGRGWERAPLVDILITEHGIAHAVVATIRCFAFEGMEGGYGPGEGLRLHRYGNAQVPSMLVRLRAHLNLVDDSMREEAESACASMTDLGWSSSAVRAWLFPNNTAFFAHAIALLSGQPEERLACALVCESVPSVEDLLTAGALVKGQNDAFVGNSYWPPLVRLAPAIGRFGADILPALEAFVAPYLDYEYKDKTGLRNMAALFAATPSDGAYRWLADHFDVEPVQGAIVDAATAFPVRILRTLAPIAAGRSGRKDAATSIVRAILRRHPGALDAVQSESSLSEGEMRALGAILEGLRGAAPAALADCPAVLTEPRWKTKKATPKLPKLALTPLGTAPSLSWPDGLQESWLQAKGEQYYWAKPKNGDWDAMFKRIGPRTLLMVNAPEALVREHLSAWSPVNDYGVKEWVMVLIARYELDVLPNILAYLQATPADAMPYALPYRAPAIASIAANALRKLKSVRRDARAWLLRHPEAAFEGLLPLAFGTKKADQTSALGAIALLVGEGHGPTLARVAARYGDAATKAAAPLLDLELLDLLPKKMPELPEWTENVVPPELRTGGALPAEALTNFLTMLAISSADQVYAGVAMAMEALTPESLARFSWSLFDAWRMAGMDSKQNWAFTQLALLGDDTCARKLTPLLRKWPGDGGHARATVGLDILASIGSDVALMNLYGISQKLKYKGLKNKASEKVQEIARERGLSELALADRLVPDFDLDERGMLALDFGPRKFTVTFDEHLKPVVRDESGKVRKSLPKVGAKDDAEKGAEATQRFKALKKDVRNVSGMQVARLEQAMCDGRSWSKEDFQSFFIDHPLMIHLVRRLVWQSGEGPQAQPFRVAEDRSLANGEDDEISLGDGAIRLCHRLDLSDEEVAKWGEVFADYELLQPFDQLGREVYALTEVEKKEGQIKRVDKLVVPTSKLLSLNKYGWSKGEPQDGGVIGWMERAVPGVGTFILQLDPGIIVGMPDEWPEQTLGTVALHEGGWAYGKALDLSTASAVVMSEVIRALESLRAS